MKSRPRARPPRPRAGKAPASRRYRQQPGIVTRAADNHLFLSGGGRNAIHELNPTGAAIWNLLETPRSEAEIADLFAAAFPERSQTALARDVSGVIAALLAAGYLVVVR